MPANDSPDRMDPELGGPCVQPIVDRTYKDQGCPASDEEHVTAKAGDSVAIIVNHGMGQQVPFETLELAAESLWRRAGASGQRPVVRSVRLGSKGKDDVEIELERVEFTFTDKNQLAHQVHFYEAYWAPLTEGKVGLGDVIAFLFRGGWDGLRNCGPRAFKRWMFGQMQTIRFYHLPTQLILFFLMLLVGSLVIINAVIVAAAASHAIGAANTFPSERLLVPLTSDLLVADFAAFLIFLATFILPRLFKIATDRTTPPRLVGWIEWLLVGVSAVAIALLGFLMAAQMNGYAPERHIPGWPLSLTDWIAQSGILTFLIWASAVAAAWGARWALVEYVGDVTAYIAAHTVSKFWDLRHAIWDKAMKVARAVYRARIPAENPTDDPVFYYRRVIMLGHSLGSVIAYDVLNGLLLEDALVKEPLGVADRTRMFLTFGSPLDRTAFIFRTQADANSEIREVAAAAVQPMIADYANRPREWVNIYSRSDIISSKLRFYDDSGGAGGKQRVNNVLDPEARTPLIAHIEYWKGKLLTDTLYRAITT